ncbi:DeoR/GlpR family DNA-binding transcription regulator [Dactylosporangium sp. CS-033363]|uniref:DeoR/GlpR family DNA-binding transcription regulator n=1 Tax=Dactylosporangium sp. CS-033363 TaxID=3239935 RepID=UPI003D8FF84B
MVQSSPKRAERLSGIVERVSGTGSGDVHALAEAFAVSPATIRRDLQLLEDQHQIARTHGGAVAMDVAFELPVRYRSGHRREEKARIAKCAAGLLPHGPLTLGLSGGTTTLLLARQLAERHELTVVTNAINIASEVVPRPRQKLIMTGGVSRTQSYELVGPIADQALAGLNMQVAVIGVDGISARGGLTTHDDVEAHTNAAMIRRADRVVVVADGSKIGKVCLAGICPLTAIAVLVTDASADIDEVEAIRRAGPEVVIAP